MDNPATPVLTARATLVPTFSGSCAKPPSKSALTGRSTALHSAVRCCSTSSRVTRLSAFPIDQAKPALVEAIALKPRCCNALALPASPLAPFVGLSGDIRAGHPALTRVVNGAAVLWCLHAIVHAVVADHAGNTQPVIFEDRRPALGLALAMLRHVAPRR